MAEKNSPCSTRKTQQLSFYTNGRFWGWMLKQTKRQVNELCFPPYDLLPCLFSQFAFYFLSNFDITLTTSRMMRSASKRRLKFTAFDRRSCQVHENDTPKNRNASIMTPHSSQTISSRPRMQKQFSRRPRKSQIWISQLR